MDYISGRMSPDEILSFDQLIAENPEYSQELVELKHMMELFAQHDGADIPEPSNQMDQNFYAMLHAEVAKDSGQKKGYWQVLMKWFQLPQLRQLAYGFSFMFFGVFIIAFLCCFSVTRLSFFCLSIFLSTTTSSCFSSSYL